MKGTICILISFIIALASCKKDDGTRNSGTDTIDNKTYFQSDNYFVYGFSFSQAKQVSTDEEPGPNITLYVNQDNTVYRLTLDAKFLYPPFYKVGDYSNEEAAKTAFDNLKTVSVTQWTDMADPINANQVWIYRSNDEKYTKFRIISTVNEIRQNIPYGECTFQWLHQPDGSATFP